MEEVLTRLKELQRLLKRALDELEITKKKVENYLQEKKEIPARIKLLLEIQQKGGCVTKEELREIWKSIGKNPRGIGGFFRGKNALIAEENGKIFITELGKEELKRHVEVRDAEE